jgi:hypothetical protein
MGAAGHLLLTGFDLDLVDAECSEEGVYVRSKRAQRRARKDHLRQKRVTSRAVGGTRSGAHGPNPNLTLPFCSLRSQTLRLAAGGVAVHRRAQGLTPPCRVPHVLPRYQVGAAAPTPPAPP